jgi:signal transduction histidine kinase/DNA-binding response OmpR family regulator
VPDERILIADDEADVLDMCTRALSLEGYRICSVQSGFDAIEKVREQPFDLLLTDIKMPGMSGLQAFRIIKQHAPDIVGVAITGYGAVETVIEALKLGMDDFLLKPFSLEELSGAVSKALEKKRLERENARLKALIPLLQLSQAFMTVTDLDTLLQQVMQLAVHDTASDLGILMLKNEASQALDARAAVGSNGAEVPSGEYALSDGIVKRTVDSGRAVVWQADAGQGPFFATEAGNALVHAAVALPLVVKGELIGILGLGKGREGDAFAQSDVELLSVLSSQAATAIQNARLFTQTRNAYEKLSALEHLKSEFISIAAHELRTPLSIITTYVDLLQRKSQAEESNYLIEVSHAVGRLTRLMNDMTNLKLLEARQVEVERAELSLPQLVAGVVERLEPLAESKGQSIAVRIGEGIPSVNADGPKIELVLQNLISNAIKFTPAGGEITIEADASESGVRVAVRDTGSGIPEEEWEWIFKPFYQLESSLIREHEGMGIGLPLAKNLVELHGGRIWVESAPGKGSTFYFTIPSSAGWLVLGAE